MAPAIHKKHRDGADGRVPVVELELIGPLRTPGILAGIPPVHRLDTLPPGQKDEYINSFTEPKDSER